VGFALSVESCTGEIIASIPERNGACSRQSIFSEYSDGHGSLGMPLKVVGLSKDAGFSGKACRRLSGHAQGGNGQRNTECCNQLKPHAAAKKTSHLHLLQNCRTRMSPGCRSVDLYCIRRGVAGANRRRGDRDTYWTQEPGIGREPGVRVCGAHRANRSAASYAVGLR
jgi:hypothetical protein